jgi:methyl-accepting chemotaxis protein
MRMLFGSAPASVHKPAGRHHERQFRAATDVREKNMNINTETLLILAGVTIAVLLQAGFLLGILLTMRKALRTAKEEADEYRGKLTPIIETGSQLIKTGKDLIAATETLINNLKPQLEAAATEVANITRDLHAQINHVQASVDEIAQKARHQADRVDGMTTSFLNGVDRFGTFLNEAVHVPVRQVNGVMAAAKAVIETLRAPSPGRQRRAAPTSRPLHVAEDKDLFV